MQEKNIKKSSDSAEKSKHICEVAGLFKDTKKHMCEEAKPELLTNIFHLG